MKLVQVAEANKKYYSKDFIHGFNTGAKTQLEADKKEMLRLGRWEHPYGNKRVKVCSECGHHFTNNLPWQAFYCPICGARMEADE